VIDRIGRTVRRAYKSSPLGVRLHLAGRLLTCPFHAVAAAVPAVGNILDAGCGHGLFTLYLAEQENRRRLIGVDIDERKLPEARAAAENLGFVGQVAFAAVPSNWNPSFADPIHRPPNGWDAIVCVDVLYLLGRERARAWLHGAASALAPGGRLVVKELDTTPTWKFKVSRFQEVLATRVLRITRGEELELVPRTDVEDALRATGLFVEEERLDRGRLHPHYLVVGTRPR
jgi:cyclopropane fatty-acyl-phospholipid synthase-like methyltransferase